mmetsp:Transcript_17392/g.70538  ORF Transcript_17392/g.70538 Transcript_17392/m.70538 type:complete len:446 (-) Transcript_17392:178-1515(-)
MLAALRTQRLGAASVRSWQVKERIGGCRGKKRQPPQKDGKPSPVRHTKLGTTRLSAKAVSLIEPNPPKKPVEVIGELPKFKKNQHTNVKWRETPGFGKESKMPEGERKVMRVRRLDIAALIRAAPCRVMNWQADYPFRKQGVRAEAISREILRVQPDVVFLGNVSTARDSSSRRDMMSVFLEKLVDNGLYELVYNEQSAKEHPYGYPINLFRRDTMTVKSSTIVDVDPKEAAYHIATETELKTSGGQVNIGFVTTRWEDSTVGGKAFYHHTETMFELLESIPMPCILGTQRFPGKSFSLVRTIADEQRGENRKISDVYVKAGMPVELEHDFDSTVNSNIYSKVNKDGIAMFKAKRKRVSRVLIGPGSKPEIMRPLVKNYFMVGKEKIEDEDVYPSKYFGVVVDLLVPVEGMAKTLQQNAEKPAKSSEYVCAVRLPVRKKGVENES